MCFWLEDMEGEAKGERQEEARPTKNHVLEHNGLNGVLPGTGVDGWTWLSSTQRNSQLSKGTQGRQA